MVGDTSFGSNEEVWDKLVELGFFPRRPTCEHCGACLNVERNRRDLHFSVRCSNRECKRYTNLMAKYQLGGVYKVRSFFAAVTCWVSGDKVSTLKGQTGMTAKTWAHYKQILQNTVDLTLDRLKANGDHKLGGPGKVVEVDECKIFSAKYHRGNPPAADDLWVVGLLERDTNGGRRSAFMVTEKRTAAVLVPFIRDWVEPGTVLVSDEWRGYTQELEQYYLRPKINHSEQFSRFDIVDGVEMNINTNHIEREWVEVRKVLRHQNLDAYNDMLNKEIFRLLYLTGKSVEEQAYVVLKKMAELNN